MRQVGQYTNLFTALVCLIERCFQFENERMEWSGDVYKREDVLIFVQGMAEVALALNESM